MQYKILHKNLYYLNDYALIPYREEDLFKIRRWRNEQINILRQKKPLTEKEQKKYFEEIVSPTFNQNKPPMMLFSFLKNEHCIGYGGLVYIDWEAGRAEVSFLLDPQRVRNSEQYKKDFSAFLTILKQIAFTKLKLNRLFTETFDLRPFHISVLEKNGFILEGRMRQHVKIKGRFIDSLIHGILRSDYEA